MLTDIIDRFALQRVLVLGDVILDHYVRGSVSRTSPEAPVPILNVEDEEWLPGGAANVARNLVTLGAEVDLVGLVGVDEAGRILRDQLAATEGLTPQLIEDPTRPTILKTRCVAQGQQMLRLDREKVSWAPSVVYDQAFARVEALLDNVDGVILSDYGKGFLHPAFIARVIAAARQRSLRVLVDPKGRDYARYRGASLLTPNQKEAAEASGVSITDNDTAAEAAAILQRTVEGEAVVITRGAAGVSVFPADGAPHHAPARAREVFDVTGAGDTFIATMGLALFSGSSLAEAAELGNLAGGFVVGLAGVATISVQELRHLVTDEGHGRRRKLLTAAELEPVCRSLHQHGSKVVFTNGFFDLLHYGHIHLLEEARGMGDCLVVAINSDAATRRLKGEPRPLLTADERALILAALPFVDYLTIFDEDTPERLLAALKPDILVKGTHGEQAPHAVGQEIVQGYGGQVRFVEVAGTTSISALMARASHNPATRSAPDGSPGNRR